MLLLMIGCAHAPPPAKKPLGTRERLQVMTTSLERADFAGALRDTDEWLGEHPDAGTVTLIYNCRTWIRWGAGDKAGAAAENEKLAEAAKGARGPLLHYWWDKAYLLAESGKHAEALAAQAEFERLGNTPDDADSREVLRAWVLLCNDAYAEARQAAAKVDLARDDDLQDLYVVARALEAGGDAAGAAAVREKIKNGPRYPMKPLILQQMERDAHPAQRAG
jgi:hypothetical protein